MRRSLSPWVLLVILAALPLSASQFIELPFDKIARESSLIVRGSVENTWSAWDDSHEIIYTYATVRVNRYFGESTGPDTLVVREVGGTVDGYTLEAIGFPAIRSGEDVVLMLGRWEDSADYRIHAFNQGKYLVRNIAGVEMLSADPVQQGDGRIGRERMHTNAEPVAGGLLIQEFAQMVDDARADRRADSDKRR